MASTPSCWPTVAVDHPFTTPAAARDTLLGVLRSAVVTVLLLGVGAAPAAAAPAPPAKDGNRIARYVKAVTRDTKWKLVDAVKLQARTFHPEGIVRYGDRWLVSSVEVTEPTVKFPQGKDASGTDRTPGKGVGHLQAFDARGALLADRVIGGSTPDEYHPGGLDYDGRDLWVTMAQYRPFSTATFLRIDPHTLDATPVIRAGDHYGGVVHDTARKRLVTLNWGAREGAQWRLPRRPHPRGTSLPQRTVANPSHFADYQDCKYLGRVRGERHPLMLCGGLTGYGAFQLGAVALLDTVTLRPVWEVPVTTLTPAGNVITRNPIDVAVVDHTLRLYLAPDDESTTVYTYEAQLG